MATPLINKLRTSGGTFYTFSSAMNDMQSALMNGDVDFTFSNFILLDLPEVGSPTSSGVSNSIYWDLIRNDSSVTGSDYDKLLSESFQNYVLNREDSMINDNENSLDFGKTVSERIFWKWLMSINALKIKTSSNNLFNEGFETEENDLDYVYHDNYKDLIKYIGYIDSINSKNKYTEVYLHVPSNHGQTPKEYINFTTNFINYGDNKSKWLTNLNYINGRDSNQTHPHNLSLLSMFDINLQNDGTTGYFIDRPNIVNNKLVYNTVNKNNINFAIPHIDGLEFNFNDSETFSYNKVNEGNNSDKFSFNTALIYYNTIDRNNGNTYRNLYGVLFLDNHSVDTYPKLKGFEKIKSIIGVNGYNGNSYSLKLNISVDTSISNSSISNIINDLENDYNTFSVDLYKDAINTLLKNQSTLESLVANLNTINSKVNLLQHYVQSNDVKKLYDKFNEVQKYIYSNNALKNEDALLNLINKNNSILNDILNGKIDNKLTIDLDLIKAGKGIDIRKSNNNLIIDSKQQSYNVNIICNNLNNKISIEPGNGNINSDIINNIILLSNDVNYYSHKSDDVLDELETNLIINISTKNIKWKRGQVFKLYFNTRINLNTYAIILKTSFSDNFNKYKEIGIINDDMLITNKPIIEIVCLDENNLIFDINILR